MAPAVPSQEVFSSSRRWRLRPAVVLTLAAALSCGGDETIRPDPPEPARVTVSPSSLEFAALRDTARLSAQVHDQYGGLMADAAVTWASSDASVASVDSEGLVRSVGNGEAVVTATAGSAAGSATVTVAQVVSSVTVSPAALEFSALGDTLRLAAEPVDANGHAVEGATVAWASDDTAVAVVDTSGLVRSVGNGEAVVTATAGSVSGTAEATVAQVVTALNMSPLALEFSALGDTLRLGAEPVDANGYLVEGATVMWASDDTAVAVVDTSGLVRSVGNGEAVVTATAGSVSGTAEATVAQVVTAVTVSPEALEFSALGDTLRLAAEPVDANGHAVEGATVAWASDDTAVTVVDTSGLVRSVGNGEAVVTATAGSVSGTAEATVAQVVTAVTVSPEALEFSALGDTLRLAAEPVDANGHAVEGATVAWASDDTAVTVVDTSGLVRSVGNGEAVVTATAGSVSGTAEATVAQVVTAVTVSPEALEFSALGDTLRLAAEPVDANGHAVEGASVTWASGDTAVTVVDTSGLVRSVGNGEAVVTATAGSVSGTAEATVAQVVTAVTVSPEALEFSALGDTLRLAAEPVDANGHAVEGVTVTWASDDDAVATVDGSGLVTAAGHGTAKIAATAGGASGAAAVTVMQSPDSVAVLPAEATVAALGDTLRLTAEAFDANGRAVAGAEFSWASSDDAVATVDRSGLVTATGDGAATITATSGSASGTATVTVAREASAVVVTPAEAELQPGDTVRLTAQAEDANGFAIADAVFDWASSDTAVAVVDSTGLVRALWDGDATITAAAGSATGSATVKVGREVAAITVTPLDAPLSVGDTVRLSAEVTDAQGVAIPGITISWESSDESVATVDSTGLVRAVGRGGAAITATANSVSASARVTVVATVNTVLLTPSEAVLQVADSIRLSATAWDGSGGLVEDAEVAWTSGDESIATVGESGLVRGVTEGRVAITATSGAAAGSADITVVEKSDRGALVALFGSTGGPNWVNKTNWLTDAPLGDWYGVTTDGVGRVIVLDLGSNNLVGSIPPEIEHLSELRRLDGSGNTLGGEIPPEIGNLSKLEELSLRHNALSGPIPPEIGRLTGMTSLSLAGNKLSGEIPVVIGNLTRLTRLHLNTNDLSGEIPSELVTDHLERLYVRGNFLHGPVPRSFLNSRIRWLGAFVPSHRNQYLCMPGTPAFVAWAEERVHAARFCNASDQDALDALYQATDGEDWTDSDGWLSGPALGEWSGVETDSLGRVTALDLAGNGLSGELPARLGHLAAMTELKLGDNSLAGPLPLSLTALSLREFRYAGTELCAPDDPAFGAWLETIAVHEGTGVQCAALTDRDILARLYHATGGANWRNSDNWLSDAPLEDWYGVDVDDDGRVTSLNLHYNNLTGVIAPELGRLTRLEELRLTSNPLTGPIPPELGDLASLRALYLYFTQLTGEIPAELGQLSALEVLWLFRMPLTGRIPPELGGLSKLQFLGLADLNLHGPIPPELGRLSKLERLYLGFNRFTGTIPPELGDLSRLIVLSLSDNDLTGSIPEELGNLARLEDVWLHNNRLTGRVPPKLGDLSSVNVLNLINNDLSGPLPATFGRLSKLEYFLVSNNPRMSGVLPGSLQSLGPMEMFLAGGTALCTPGAAAFREWLATVRHWRILSCPTGERSHAYLTQAVQSLQHPVPLLADEPALLRVFVTVPRATDATIPPVRARFYHDGSEVHVIDIAGGSEAIPVDLREGELSKSANSEVPGWLVRPGLEIVLEIDPDSTLDADLGLQRRIPRTGRKTVDVREMPTMHLTVLPFLWTENPDSSILDVTDGMTAQDTLLWDTRTLLPVGDFEVEVHDPVWTPTDDIYQLLREVEAIRVMEGKPGHYMGTMTNARGASGVAYTPGLSSFSLPGGTVIAHELGHNMNLLHAPCGEPGAPDPSFPSPTGSIGVWGYDFRDRGSVVPASHKDLMSYCDPAWISDYSFTSALFYRLNPGSASAFAGSSESLLVWGGLDEDGDPFLEPAFVVDAPSVLPAASGDYSLTGRTRGGEELFALSFDMQEVSDGGTPSFTFALPALADWAGRLAGITLSGPEGSVSLDGGSDRSMTILRDPRTGQVRGILRDLSPEGVARISRTLGRGLEVLFSRGVPDGAAWN